MTSWVSGTGVPSSADTAIFDNAGNGNTSIDLGGSVTINNIHFDTAAAASYTIGDIDDTLTFDNGGDIIVNSGVTTAQNIAANDLVLGNAAGQSSYVWTNSGSGALTVASDVDSGALTEGTVHIDLKGGGQFDLTGGYAETGGANQIQFNVYAGSTVNFSGDASAAAGNLHNSIRDNSTFTITGTGPQGATTVNYGTLNINTANQEFKESWTLGNGTQGNRTIRVEDGAAAADLTIDGTVTSGAAANDHTVIGDGTLVISSTGSITGHDRMTFSNKLTTLETGAVTGTGNVFVQQRNDATEFSDFELVLDINSQTLTLGGNFIVSAYNATLVPETMSTRIIDSDISGTIIDDGTHNLTKNRAGTLRLSSASNNYNLLLINGGRVVITDVGALGDDRISLGDGTADGTLEYTGSGGDIGTLTLSAANTYTGGTLIEQGEILITNAAALGTGLLTFNDLGQNNILSVTIAAKSGWNNILSVTLSTEHQSREFLREHGHSDL